MRSNPLHRLSARLASRRATRNPPSCPSIQGVEPNGWPTTEEIAREAGVDLYSATTHVENAASVSEASSSDASFYVSSSTSSDRRLITTASPPQRRSTVRRSISNALKGVRRHVSGLFRRRASHPGYVDPGFREVDWNARAVKEGRVFEGVGPMEEGYLDDGEDE